MMIPESRSFTPLKRKLSSKKAKIPNVYPTKKPKTCHIPTLNDPELLDAIDINETWMMLQMLRRDFPLGMNTKVPPIILKPQLYSCAIDKTTADRDLNELVNKGKVRVFKIVGKKEDYSIMTMEDFKQLLLLAKEKAQLKNQNTCILDDFEKILQAHVDLIITKERLYKLVKTLTEDDITLLIKSGLLIRRDVHSFWFSIPNSGVFYGLCEKGDAELLRALKRQRSKLPEMLLKDLEKKKNEIYSRSQISY